MKTNLKHSYSVSTHGGAPAFPHLTAEQELRRTVMSCLLWETNFYESGQSVADRIKALVAQVSQTALSQVMDEARNTFHLRHVPLLLAREAARNGRLTADALNSIIQRPDELTEFLSIYWRDGKAPISKQVKKGLARAFRKFDAYALAKYNRDAAIKLRDVLFLVHAKPRDEEQAAVWKKLVDGTLESPDTWEVGLSAGADKRETFERLLRERKLGYLALLRNLRNMVDAEVDEALIVEALETGNSSRVLPFRFIAAARACPRLEPMIDEALARKVEGMEKLPGTTVVLVDVSRSMDSQLSGKSDLTRMDAAAALAAVIPAESLRVLTFSYQVVEVPPRRGMAGVDAVIRSQQHGGTDLAGAVAEMNQLKGVDRLIVITDEQATTGRVPDPVVEKAYMINVGVYQNGVGYGRWTHIDGFSEGVLRWIAEFERG